MRITSLLIILLSLSALGQQVAPPPSDGDKSLLSPEINTTLMETTFMVFGPSARVADGAKSRFGTGFVMARQIQKDSKAGRYVFITAKHVFEDIKGDTATVMLRKRNPAGDAEPYPFQLKIRDAGKVLYTTHPTKDVAAIDVSLPIDSIVVAELGGNITNINWLATDDFLKGIQIHPGDELLCLGYPLGIGANDAGYPILRSGKIASYPVIPLKKPSRILYDFRVHPGNSGGPVYFSFDGRAYKEVLNFGAKYQKIFGLVTEEYLPVENTDPSIGVIVPSIYIKETIDLLAGFETTITD